MNATQFAKAYKLFDRVKELDAEILELEKVAQMVAEKRTEIKLSLKVTDLEKKSDKDKVSFDEDGSLVYGEPRSSLYVSMFRIGLPLHEPEKEQDKYDLHQDAIISDRIALQVLGVLLAEKMEARDLAIKQLNKIGISI